MLLLKLICAEAIEPDRVVMSRQETMNIVSDCRKGELNFIEAIPFELIEVSAHTPRDISRDSGVQLTRLVVSAVYAAWLLI